MKLLAVSLFCKLKRDAQSEPSYQSVLDLRTVGHILKGKGGLLESCESEILRQGDPQMAEVLFLQKRGVLFLAITWLARAGQYARKKVDRFVSRPCVNIDMTNQYPE